MIDQIKIMKGGRYMMRKENKQQGNKRKKEIYIQTRLGRNKAKDIITEADIMPVIRSLNVRRIMVANPR